MTTFERRQTILRLVHEQQSVKVTDLAQLLDVSEGTIRNDLIALDDARRLKRVRGGAVPRDADGLTESRLDQQMRVNATAKRRIAQWASGMIESGDTILLDGSTTVLHLARLLEDRHNLTVVTNGIEAARLLARDPSNTVILPGGVLKPSGQSVIGQLGELVIKDLHIKTAFVSCAGFSFDAGLMESNLQEAQLKAQMVQSAQRTVALMDTTKFEKISLTPFAAIEDVEHIVTEDGLPDDAIAHIRRAGVSLTVCAESTAHTYPPLKSGNGTIKIGFANLSEQMPFGRDVRRGLQRAAEASNRVDLILADNQLSGEVALRVADELIAANIDLAIEFQIDESAGNLIMHRFSDAGIPVIAVDIPMVGATFFGVDNYAVGRLAGRALGEAVRDRWGGAFDKLVVLEHPRAGVLTASRITGQIDGFKSILPDLPPGKIARLDSGNTASISEEEMANLLDALPHATHLPVICFNDDALVGALDAARNANRADHVLLVGQGADRRLLDLLRAGTPQVVGSTAFRPERYGEKLVEIALKIINGDPVPPAVYVEHTFIHADNIEQHYPQT